MVETRPPIVAVLGHVDHGKTSLLDAIRKTTVAVREHGGITQHIGAYEGEFKIQSFGGTQDDPEQRRMGQNAKVKITFIDTPGHAAFAKMRARGANVADIAILVVAANDGVMFQTKESIEHIKAAGIPMIVAINKVDLPEADVEKVKGQLVEVGVLVEGYGGEVVAVPVSAKTGEGVDHLLEMISLLGEMQNLKADPDGQLEGVVIESRMDSRRGVTATVLVRNGTLRVGDTVEAEDVSGKMKALFKEGGESVILAGPSVPVEVLGLSAAPAVGVKISRVIDGKSSNISVAAPVVGEVKAESGGKNGESQKLKIILKADVAGSMEALKGELGRDVEIVSVGLGDVSDSDVLLARSTGSTIYGFNVKFPAATEKLAEEENVKVKTFRVIYELVEEVRKRVALLQDPSLGEEVLGRATVVAEFKIDGVRVAGCKVSEGKVGKNNDLHVTRGGEALANVRLKSLRHKKEDIEEAKINEEFGAVFSPYVDFKIGDMLISYRNLSGS